MANTNFVATKRADQLARRLEQGAGKLAALAEKLSESDWKKKVPGDGRTIGVLVHHVASVYPLEVQIAQTLATGKRIEGVTKDAIDKMNAEHARDNASVGKEAALALLKKNSAEAAEAIRMFTDEELDSAAEVSLYADAPLTAQFFIEDHALRHSYHHLARIKATIKK